MCILAKKPPLAGFPSPSGGVPPSVPHSEGPWRPFRKPLPSGAFLLKKIRVPWAHHPGHLRTESLGRRGRSLGASWRPLASHTVLIFPQGHEDSEYVLSFEYGQQEGGFLANEQTHRITVI